MQPDTGESTAAARYGPHQKKALARLHQGARLAVELGGGPRRRFYWLDGAPAPREDSIERLIRRDVIREGRDGFFGISQTVGLVGRCDHG